MRIWSQLSLVVTAALVLFLGVSPAAGASLEAQAKKLRAEIRKDTGLRPPSVPIPANNPQTKEKVRLTGIIPERLHQRGSLGLCIRGGGWVRL